VQKVVTLSPSNDLQNNSASRCYVTETGYRDCQSALQGYAIEHRMLVLMANYAAPTRDFACAGGSAIWSASGEPLASAGKTGQAIVLATKRGLGWIGDLLSVN